MPSVSSQVHARKSPNFTQVVKFVTSIVIPSGKECSDETSTKDPAAAVPFVEVQNNFLISLRLNKQFQRSVDLVKTAAGNE
jgi:hypothetical protein